MSLESNTTTKISLHQGAVLLHQQPLDILEERNLIHVRELDKRYTHANPKSGKCTMNSCQSHATHWLTRQSENYCQSDMVCHQHAKLWMEIKNLVSQSV